MADPSGYPYGPYATGYDFGPSLLQPQAAPDSAQALGSGALTLQLAGALSQAVGAWYAAQTARHEAKSASLAWQHRQTIANLNAREAEKQAQAVLEAGEQEKGRYLMQVGREREERRVMQAVSGTEADDANAAEVRASAKLLAQIDSQTIDSNTLRAAQAARGQRVGFQNESLLAGVSARNARRTARSINPVAAAAGSLLATSGPVAQRWYEYRSRYG